MRLGSVALLGSWVALVACSKSSSNGASAASSGSGGGLDSKVTFPLTSSDFSADTPLPKVSSCDGGDRSPALAWSGNLGETKSFALIADDPDAPSGDFTHWVLFDIPKSASLLTQGVNDVGVQGKNDFDKLGYGGACPPPGKLHHYYFRLYALDIEKLGLGPGASRADVEGAMKGHVLAKGELMGTYERK